ncbi:MAG: LPS export ABC transporter periplasmic protein LptC [Proteobacteria bacterium]|nr:LPS export ABC transporter periplasmic protein LptC [Pseudomonadota bacterium]
MALAAGNSETTGGAGWARRWLAALRAGPAGALPPHLANDPAFRAAVRHSARVRRIRRAIPLLASLTVIALIVRSFAILLGGPEASVSNLSIQGRKIVMDNPRLSGFKRDGRSYELNATSAVQDLKAPNIVDLDQLNARMQTGNDGWANMTGRRGTYDSKAEVLDVEGDVQVRTESGMNARLKDAHIEFKTGNIVTEKPVTVTMPQGVVESERMQVTDNGRRLVFEGRVRSVFQNAPAPNQTTSEEEPLEKPAPAPEVPAPSTDKSP